MKKRKKLAWRIFPSYLLITVISLVAVSWYASKSLRNFFLDQTLTNLEARAHLLEKQMEQFLLPLAGAQESRSGHLAIGLADTARRPIQRRRLRCVDAWHSTGHAAGLTRLLGSLTALHIRANRRSAQRLEGYYQGTSDT